MTTTPINSNMFAIETGMYNLIENCTTPALEAGINFGKTLFEGIANGPVKFGKTLFEGTANGSGVKFGLSLGEALLDKSVSQYDEAAEYLYSISNDDEEYKKLQEASDTEKFLLSGIMKNFTTGIKIGKKVGNWIENLFNPKED